MYRLLSAVRGMAGARKSRSVVTACWLTALPSSHRGLVPDEILTASPAQPHSCLNEASLDSNTRMCFFELLSIDLISLLPLTHMYLGHLLIDPQVRESLHVAVDLCVNKHPPISGAYLVHFIFNIAASEWRPSCAAPQNKRLVPTHLNSPMLASAQQHQRCGHCYQSRLSH